MIRLHTHTHYRQVVEIFYTNFVRNVNNKIDMNLVKGDEFL